MSEPTSVLERHIPKRSAADVLRGLARSPRTYLVIMALLFAQVWSAQRTEYAQGVASLIGIYAIIGSGLVLLIGTSGQLSLGTSAFVAVGAFTAANVAEQSGELLNNVLNGLPGPVGLPTLAIEIAVALVLSLIVGALVGLPALRLSGLYLAVGTLALGYATTRTIENLESISNGSFGKFVPRVQIEAGGSIYGLLWATTIVLIACFLIVSNILRSRTGRALTAIRTAEPAAASVGIEVAKRKVLAFAMSAALAGVGGVLYAHKVGRVVPEDFNAKMSIILVIMVLIGGQRVLPGALVGAMFWEGFPEYLRTALNSFNPSADLRATIQLIVQYRGIPFGIILLLIMVFSPEGIVGVAKRLWGAFRARWFTRQATRHATRLPCTADANGSADTAALTPEHGAPTLVGSHSLHGLTQAGVLLQIEDLRVDYGGVVAVDDVCFVVQPGEVAGLIGPNGAGKTTAFNAITGLIPAQGSVLLDGEALERRSVLQRVRSGFGRTFQNLSLHEGMTPVQHVLIGHHRFLRYGLFAEMVRWPTVVREERRAIFLAEEILDALDLSHVAYERADLLPYGMQKRVDVARALASRPRILMLDEPAAGLPHEEANALIDRVLDITREAGTSVIIIEHNVELVSRVCERIRVLDSGRLIADGDAEEVMHNQRVVEAYLGA